MRLIDLNPRWIGLYGWASPDPFYTGISFECPHCRTQRLAVGIYPPIDPSGHVGKDFEWRKEFTPTQPVWDRTGDTFDTISLSPSVDASAIRIGGHWHGHITNGDCR